MKYFELWLNHLFTTQGSQHHWFDGWTKRWTQVKLLFYVTWLAATVPKCFEDNDTSSNTSDLVSNTVQYMIGLHQTNSSAFQQQFSNLGYKQFQKLAILFKVQKSTCRYSTTYMYTRQTTTLFYKTISQACVHVYMYKVFTEWPSKCIEWRRYLPSVQRVRQSIEG